MVVGTLELYQSHPSLNNNFDTHFKQMKKDLRNFFYKMAWATV